MKLRDHEFSENELSQLRYHRDRQENPDLKLRFIALLTLAFTKNIEAVASSFGKCTATIENWLRQFLTDGTEKLGSYEYKPKQSYLDRYQMNQVRIFVSFENPSTTKEVRDYIEQKFGISYCVEAVRKLLIKHGLKVLRPKTVPGNPPSVEKQKQFIDEYHEIKQKPGTIVLFLDVMHMIHQNIPAWCWGNPQFPPVLETNSGRNRLNIIGAYHVGTHRLIHLTGEENCNADRVIKFLELIDKDPIYLKSDICLVSDNAKYFHAKKVSKWLERHKRIRIKFLPSYAPNLNLIERFWGFAKEKLVKSHYYKEYKTFRAKVFQFLNHIDKHIDKLRTLITENFQIISYA